MSEGSLAEELGRKRVDVDRVRELCQELLEQQGRLPDHLREDAWVTLLACRTKDSSAVDAWVARFRSGEDSAEKKDDPVWKTAASSDWFKVLKADVPRTRTDNAFFIENPRAHIDLELLLTFYCVSRGVAYKQGLNEILAPFLALRGTDEVCRSETKPLGKLYMAFYSLINKFLPSIYDDEAFQTLQLLFRLFQQLLLYHDPELCSFLDQHDLLPELYAIPWFITLFARAVPLQNVYALWDLYIVHDDSFLHFLMAVVIMIQNRERMLAADAHELAVEIANMQKALKEMTGLNDCVKKALRFRAQTPLSFRQELFEISFSQKKTKLDADKLTAKLAQYRSQPCMLIPPEEVLQQISSDSHVVGTVKLIVLDCRYEYEYINGHLPCSVLLDENLISDTDALGLKFKDFEDLRGCHLCLIGRGDSPEDHEATKFFIFFFLQHGFPYISWCKPGYRVCHDLVLKSSLELIDHNPKKCRVCNPKARIDAPPPEEPPVVKQFFSGVKSFFADLTVEISKVAGRLEEKSVGTISVKSLETEDSETFKCLQVLSNAMSGSKTVSRRRLMIVTSSEVIVLEPNESTPEMGVIVSKYHVSKLLKITSKVPKRKPTETQDMPAPSPTSSMTGSSPISGPVSPLTLDVADEKPKPEEKHRYVTFHWKVEPDPHVVSYFVEDWKRCIEIISGHFRKFKSETPRATSTPPETPPQTP